ncbi:AAA family ATPase [Ectothiorhodospira shaposhnikovii]|uniref:AAA family ATPase n=1 Tax=Ectothiorhodospira shaposhnikovii TaxID=1054 RepID=UPI001EE7DE07|nr:AAA family ATPase [Ectothiorhodospira shaposhnikovii]MCG5512788.1 AAA family ATPase [Ectothiorhodospira shaposhnikovii]
MKIERLEIENFLTIGQAELELAGKSLVLIQGRNEDDDSANSNGAGKSTLPDALCWALYGETARGVTGDAVISKKAGKGTRVALVVVDDTDIYRIVRHRKHKEGKSALWVFRLKPDGTEDDLTLGTDKQTQEVVERIMGCSLEVFRAAVYAGQEAMPDLPGMTDKALKVLVEEAAGIHRLQAAYDVARKRLSTAESELAAKVSRLEAKRDALSHSKLGLAEIEKSIIKWREDNSRLTDEVVASAKSLSEKIKLMEKEESYLSESEVKSALDEVTKTLTGRGEQEKAVEKAQAAHSSAQSEMDRLKFVVQTKKAELAKARADLDGIKERVGKPCGECGKPYEEKDLEAAEKLSRKRVAGVEAEAINVLKAYRKAVEVAETRAAEVESLKAALPDVSAALHLQSQLLEKAEKIRDHKNAIVRSRESLAGMVNEVKRLRAAVNPHEEMRAKIAERCKDLERGVSELEQEVSAQEELRELARDAATVFGPAGVRAHILDTVTPFLNERTAHYLGALSDGNITATWSTLSATAKGELREKFNIEVSNDKGAESFGGLSGGEKRKVRVATTMALQDLVASRATKPIDLFVADEIDHALDDAGLERLMGILDEKARDRGTVLVISHNDLADYIGQVCTVTKKGGVSTVSGALTKEI